MSNDIYLCCCAIRSLKKKNIMRRSTQFSTSLFLSLSLVLPFACCTGTRIIGKILQQHQQQQQQQQKTTKKTKQKTFTFHVIFPYLAILYTNI